MEKTKLLFSISDETLLKRIEILQEQIKECEDEIPYSFWCNSCKEKMKKVKNFYRKIHNKETIYPGHNISSTGGHLTLDVLQNAITQIKQVDPFSNPTATVFLEYKCLKCGFVYHLCHPGHCKCGGEVETI